MTKELEFEYHLAILRTIQENLIDLGATKNAQKLEEAIRFFEKWYEEVENSHG